MNKLKVFFYPQAVPMRQNEAQCYANSVPFTIEGVNRWVELAGMKGAEFLHMGCISEFSPNPFPTEGFWLLRQSPERHLVDLEGDYLEGTFREEFAGTVRVANGAPLRWRSDKRVFPRLPPVRMLMEMVGMNGVAPPPKRKYFGFIGKRDKAGVRQKVGTALMGSGVAGRCALNDEWMGPSAPDHPLRVHYSDLMIDCSVALCPQGEGVATGRFYEACFWGRFPVVIGQTMLLGEDQFDMSFVQQLDSALSVEELRDEFKRINEMPFEEMVERGKAARAYWDAVVKPYLTDPTLFFIQWLERTGLRDGQGKKAN